MKKLLTPIKNLLTWIDNPKSFLKIFQVLYYYLPAAVICIIPILMVLYDNDALVLVFLLPVALLSFCIYIIRGKELLEMTDINKKFFILPAIGHYLKTSSEIYAAIVLLSPLTLLMGSFGPEDLGIGFLDYQPDLLVPLYTTIIAYLILFIGKYISEVFVSIAHIANNIKK
jgi:hypothetical protein